MEYVVKAGDTLWGISERLLGDPFKWKQIYWLNAKVIRAKQPPGFRGPHWIFPGTRLFLKKSG